MQTHLLPLPSSQMNTPNRSPLGVLSPVCSMHSEYTPNPSVHNPSAHAYCYKCTCVFVSGLYNTYRRISLQKVGLNHLLSTHSAFRKVLSGFKRLLTSMQETKYMCAMLQGTSNGLVFTRMAALQVQCMSSKLPYLVT